MNCKATTASGQPCKMPATKGGRYCFTHSPATRAAQAQARKRGGEARHTPHFGSADNLPSQVTTLEDANKILSYILAEVIGMDNSIARARVLLACYEMFLKSIEIGEIEKRLQALEAMKK